MCVNCASTVLCGWVPVMALFYSTNSRYYNPENRFINADGLIGETGDILGHNMYAYCRNNPVMYYDPSGYFFEEIGDWFNDRLDDLTDWLNEKPRNVNDSSSLGFGLRYLVG